MTAETTVLTLLHHANPTLATIAERNIDVIRYWLARGWSAERIVSELYCVKVTR